MTSDTDTTDSTQKNGDSGKEDKRQRKSKTVATIETVKAECFEPCIYKKKLREKGVVLVFPKDAIHPCFKVID